MCRAVGGKSSTEQSLVRGLLTLELLLLGSMSTVKKKRKKEKGPSGDRHQTR